MPSFPFFSEETKMAKSKVIKSSFGSKFASGLDKAFKTIKSPTFAVGFSNVNIWANLGNYALNRIMSGRFDRGLLFGRKYIFYGESGSGKSYLAATTCASSQKELGAHIVWIDVEKANDQDAGKEWLKNAGIDIEHEGFHYIRAGTTLDARKILAEICEGYRTAQEEGEEVPPMVIVVDSWAMMNTPNQMEAAEKGEQKFDRGLRIQMIGQIIIDCVHMTSGLPILTIGVQHIMDSQEEYGPKHKTTGGNKMLYAASGCLLLTKARLGNHDSENEEVKSFYKNRVEKMAAHLKDKFKANSSGKGGKAIGITCVVENIKSRASKPYEKIEIQIPYLTGIDPYSGLFDVQMAEGVITVPSNGRYQYTNDKGEVITFYKKDYRDHADEIMKVMQPDMSIKDASKPAVIMEESEGPDGE